MDYLSTLDDPHVNDTQEQIAEDCFGVMAAIEADLRRLLDMVRCIDRPELVLPIVYGLRDVRSVLSSTKEDEQGIYQQIEEHVFSIMGERKMTVAPFGEFKARRGMNRKGWRYEDLVPVLVARALDERKFDPETGEAEEREAETVARVLLECLSLSGGKVGGLRARGIEPSAFCDEDPKAWSLELPKKVDLEDLGSMGEAA